MCVCVWVGVVCSQLHFVATVPKSYYVRDQVQLNYEQTEMVNRGSSLQMEYEILAPGCILRSDLSRIILVHITLVL